MPRRTPCLHPLDGPAVCPPEAGSAGVAVVDHARAAGALLNPIRRRLLAELQSPGSATTAAGKLGLSRQSVNYHVRALEEAGLVEQVGQRQRRGLSERLVRASAAYYLISPDAIGSLGEAPLAATERFSATYQVAVAARTIKEVAALAALARAAGQRLTTMTLDAELGVASPAARDAFANDLADAVMGVIARHHDESASQGRRYRVFAGAHPVFDPSGDSPARRRPRDRQPTSGIRTERKRR